MQFQNPLAISLAHRVRASVRDPAEDVAALSRSVLADSGVSDDSSELSSSLAAELHGFGVSSATSLLIERQRLFALADSAALAGAESFDPALLRAGASGIVVTLESDRVRGAVSRFLAATDVSGFESLVVERAGTGDGRSADVELSSLWRPPLVSEFFPAALRMSVSARSQAFIR